MEYTKQAWTAPTGTGLSRYAKSGETDTHIELALDPVNLTNTPTPFTMARMAHMEEGIAKAYDTAPPTPWAQYSGKDIPQLPDNVAGTTQKITEFTSASAPAGWTRSNNPSFELVGTKLKIIASERYAQIYSPIVNQTICVTIEEISGAWGYAGKTAVVGNNVAYKTSGTTVLYCNTESGYVILSAIYIGTGAYDRLVFDNSYHYRHLLNSSVVPTPQGLYFNGATSYLRSKDKVTLPDVFTFSATVNCAVKSATQMFFSQGTSTIPTTPFIHIYRRSNTDNLVIQVSNGTVVVEAFGAVNFFTGLDNTDIKTEVTTDFINKTIKVYRNNVQIGTTASAPTMVKPVTAYIYFGDYVTGAGKILGYMRNIQLYDTALTDTQRNWLAQGNTPPVLYDVTNYETEGYVSIQDADGTNTGVETDVDSNGNRILKLPATIKASITGKASTADKWKTARNITISDADGTNTGTAVSVDGSENETLKLPATIKATLSGNAATATLATQANAIKPLGNYIILPAVPTSVTKIIKIATVDWTYAGSINIRCRGGGIEDGIKVYIGGYQSSLPGISVICNKLNIGYGLKKIIVTRVITSLDSNKNIYAEIVTNPNNASTTILGVIENSETFTSSMTEVSSVEGTVIDSLSLDYYRGDISSYQHEFTKNIIGNLTGNASTADKWKTARNISISDADGTNTGTAVSVDGSENETLKLPATIKANVTGNADTASKANVRVSLRHGNTWFDKTWTGLTSFEGISIWTDGDNIYHSNATTHYVLNKATSTWVTKTWTGLTDFRGDNIWTDGENIYYSTGTAHYVLNKATSTWSVKTWTGLTDFDGYDIWTDGENIYYSYGTANQYVLNKATSTWSVKTWTGLTNLIGARIWTDGDNIYHSSGTAHYVLNKATSTWSVKTWTGLTGFDGYDIWTDGENIYYSTGTAHYVLNKATSTWSVKTWTGLTNFSGINIWTDGENIYYSTGTTHYVLPATRHNYVDDAKYNSLFGTVTKCKCSTLSDSFVFSNE